MKSFQIFRYLKKWKYFVLAVALLGSVFVYYYSTNNQSYTSTAYIEFTNAQAAEGLTPAGTPVDVSEIYCVAVITNAIDELNLHANVEMIRSRCKVSKVIPKDEQDKKEALISEGKEYEYIPTKYKVTFSCGSAYSQDYARIVLDSILSNYFTYYSEKYINYAVFPNNASNIDLNEYDYISCIEMLEETASEISTYLNMRSTSYPNFRSACTGYSFRDLEDYYNNVTENTIPKLYALVLDNKLVWNKEALIKRYENMIKKYELDIETCTTNIDKVKELIIQFGKKTLDGSVINYSFGGAQGANEGLIIGNVENNGNTHSVETTYDKLINTYKSRMAQKESLSLSLENARKRLTIFSGLDVKNDRDSQNAIYISELITETAESMNSLYASILPTIDEFNDVNGAENIAMLTNVVSSESINVKLYLMLAVVLFFSVGCAGAIVFGRIGDVVEYYVFTDRKTQLPNRYYCDMQIARLEKQTLQNDFSCMVFKMLFPELPGRRFLRKDGDMLLEKFSALLKSILSEEGFVGYNNSGQFIAFIENCQRSKIETIYQRIRDEAEYQSSYGDSIPMKFLCGAANAGDDDTFEVRELIRKAFKRLAESKPDEAAM